MSPFVIALAINLFLGTDPDCKPSYSLFADNEMWYLLDDSGIDEIEPTNTNMSEGA